MANLSFGEQVKRWSNKTNLKTELLFQMSTQALALETNEPRAKGGNMPVDTGFLRNSLSAAINSVPTGETTGTKGYSNTDFDATDLLVVVNEAKLGDRIVLGYTAQYAPFMEAKYAFVRLAVQNWGSIVADSIKKLDSFDE